MSGKKIKEITTYLDPQFKFEVFDKVISYYKYNQKKFSVEKKLLVDNKIKELYSYEYQ